MCTAPVEALSHREIGEDLRGLIRRLDKSFAQRLKRARDEGKLDDSVDPELAAKLLQATLHSLALRARAGASDRELRKAAYYAVDKLTAYS